MNANGRIAFENRLWKLQDGRCAICSFELVRDARFLDEHSWNLDHVYPRSRYRRLGNRGNVLLTHVGCNTRKSDRDPTGCEILLLHAVNARLGHTLLDIEARDYVDETRGPSAIQLAWQRLIEQQAAA